MRSGIEIELKCQILSLDILDLFRLQTELFITCKDIACKAIPSFEMKLTIVFVALISVAYGANHACLTVDQIADEVIKLTDKNQDGVVSYDEFSQELMTDWNLSNSSCLSFHDFTTNWISHFHDHHDTAHKFFNNLDLSGDGKLCLLDVAVQLITYDKNPADGQIQPAEFHTFMHAMHPDSHQNNGHGHGC